MCSITGWLEQEWEGTGEGTTTRTLTFISSDQGVPLPPKLPPLTQIQPLLHLQGRQSPSTACSGRDAAVLSIVIILPQGNPGATKSSGHRW